MATIGSTGLCSLAMSSWSAGNRGLPGALVKKLVKQSPPPGVLAYDGDDVVGWAGVHPRADTTFATNRKIPHPDDLDV